MLIVLPPLKLYPFPLTHVSPKIPKRVIGKQCRPRSDAAECDLIRVYTINALKAGIAIKQSNNKN